MGMSTIAFWMSIMGIIILLMGTSLVFVKGGVPLPIVILFDFLIIGALLVFLLN